MLVTDCPVLPDHLSKEKCNKTNLRYLNYIVEFRIISQDEFTLHVSGHNLRNPSRRSSSKLTPVFLQSQDESEEGRRDAGKVPDLPHELQA